MRVCFVILLGYAVVAAGAKRECADELRPRQLVVRVEKDRLEPLGFTRIDHSKFWRGRGFSLEMIDAHHARVWSAFFTQPEFFGFTELVALEYRKTPARLVATTRSAFGEIKVSQRGAGQAPKPALTEPTPLVPKAGGARSQLLRAGFKSTREDPLFRVKLPTRAGPHQTVLAWLDGDDHVLFLTPFELRALDSGSITRARLVGFQPREQGRSQALHLVNERYKFTVDLDGNVPADEWHWFFDLARLPLGEGMFTLPRVHAAADGDMIVDGRNSNSRIRASHAIFHQSFGELERAYVRRRPELAAFMPLRRQIILDNEFVLRRLGTTHQALMDFFVKVTLLRARDLLGDELVFNGDQIRVERHDGEDLTTSVLHPAFEINDGFVRLTNLRTQRTLSVPYTFAYEAWRVGFYGLTGSADRISPERFAEFWRPR